MFDNPNLCNYMEMKSSKAAVSKLVCDMLPSSTGQPAAYIQ